tara:strand:- start:188 stop:445 length:258 start_codon:yes stop_codon:yes gene_type:complete
MKAINQYIVIDKIKEQPTKIAGLEITEDLDADNRYAKGKVITHGKFAEGVNDGDIVYYDKHVGHSVRFNDNVYEVITIRDVVLVE